MLKKTSRRCATPLTKYKNTKRVPPRTPSSRLLGVNCLVWCATRVIKRRKSNEVLLRVNQGICVLLNWSKYCCLYKTFLLAGVSHDEAKWNERRETSTCFRRVSYHACARVSLTTSDVFVTCETTQKTGLRSKWEISKLADLVEAIIYRGLYNCQRTV